MLTIAEENYLKSIYKITERQSGAVSTNTIAHEMNTAPASATDMIRRLSQKGLLDYEKYRGVNLSEQGQKAAITLVRKHRLWEVFLFQELGFGWDEVHEIAEQLEHVQSPELVIRLDNFLGNPKFDPHGDPIPNANGRLTMRNQKLLTQLGEKETGVVVGVRQHSKEFLQMLDQKEIRLGQKITVHSIFDFDQSVAVEIGQKPVENLSVQVAKNILVRKQ